MRLQCVWFLVGAAEASSVMLFASDRDDIMTQQDESCVLQQLLCQSEDGIVMSQLGLQGTGQMQLVSAQCIDCKASGQIPLALL